MAKLQLLQLAVTVVVAVLLVSATFFEGVEAKQGRGRGRGGYKSSSKKGGGSTNKGGDKGGDKGKNYGGGGLAVGFYSKSCPQVEHIVYFEMRSAVGTDPMTAPDILRLFFHDCFVRGCDVSILLKGAKSEVNAPPNMGLEGMGIIDSAKAALESACPGVVSCADIIAFAARDGVVLLGSKFWNVEAGRRDRSVSLAAEASRFLPGADMTAPELIANFRRKGLSAEQLVDLSGAHTIGDVRCRHIDSRIHKYPSPSMVDPEYPEDFATSLKMQCPRPDDSIMKIDLDQTTGKSFDSQYYENLVNKKGLLRSDQTLLDDKTTAAIVMKNRDKKTFLDRFAKAMVVLGRVEVLTGSAGQIRRHCSMVN